MRISKQGRTLPAKSAASSATAREFSAGGVVVRRRNGQWWMAAIQPTGRFVTGNSASGEKRPARKQPVVALPKGIIDPGETTERAAVREVHEETGLEAEVISKLGTSKYVYKRSWGDGRRVFKVVTFYLLRYRAGRLGRIAPAMRKEVARCQWLSLSDAPRMITYDGDRNIVLAAQRYVAQHLETA